MKQITNSTQAKSSSPFNEESINFLTKTLKVSREQVIETIRLSHISAAEIVDYVKKRRLGLRKPS